MFSKYKVVVNPNITILMPGCNANCSFCTNTQANESECDVQEMTVTIKRVLSILPPYFNQISISGGEPTVGNTENLNRVLSTIKNGRNPYGIIKKVVLTTNGNKLLYHSDKDLFRDVVDHVNISRHDIGYRNNVNIFKTKSIIDDGDLLLAVENLNKSNIDVNFNCVYGERDIKDELFVSNFIQYAKEHNVSSVTLRYDCKNNTLEDTYLEKLYKDYKNISHTNCKVCKSTTKLIEGIPVTFKSSLNEPSDEISDNVIYELIIHPDGTISLDWAGNKRIAIEELVELNSDYLKSKTSLSNNKLTLNGKEYDIGQFNDQEVRIGEFRPCGGGHMTVNWKELSEGLQSYYRIDSEYNGVGPEVQNGTYVDEVLQESIDRLTLNGTILTPNFYDIGGSGTGCGSGGC